MTDQTQTVEPISTWAVVELKGHVKTAGRVSEEPHFGTVMLHLDVPAVGNIPEHTEYIEGEALYRVTPCTEEAARVLLARTQPASPSPFALPRAELGQRALFVMEDDDESGFERDD